MHAGWLIFQAMDHQFTIADDLLITQEDVGSEDNEVGVAGGDGGAAGDEGTGVDAAGDDGGAVYHLLGAVVAGRGRLRGWAAEAVIAEASAGDDTHVGIAIRGAPAFEGARLAAALNVDDAPGAHSDLHRRSGDEALTVGEIERPVEAAPYE